MVTKRVTEKSDAGENEKPKKKQMLIVGTGEKFVKKFTKEGSFIGKDILMTDKVYGKKPPADMKGMFFHYTVIGYDHEDGDFRIKYCNRMITSDGSNFQHQDGGREYLDDVKLKNIEDGHEMYLEAYGRVNKAQRDRVAAAETLVKKKSAEGVGKICMDDLDKAAESSEQGWKDEKVLLVEFAGLVDSSKLSDIKIMGAMLNPLFQTRARMVESGLCTEEQYDHGKDELLDRVARAMERGNEHVVAQTMAKSSGNKWDDCDLFDSTSPVSELAEKEWKTFCAYNHSSYLPEMEPFKTLGAVDEDGNPQEPTFAFGAVTKRGKNLPSGKNHADYIDKHGYYDLTRYLHDHDKYFHSVAIVGIGQILIHTTAEVDCESLFSQSAAQSDPRRARTDIQTYERLVTCKHRMHRIHCSLPKVQKLFLELWKTSGWKTEDEDEDKAFLELEKEIHLEMFPNCQDFFNEDEESKDEESGKKTAVVTLDDSDESDKDESMEMEMDC